MPEIRLSSKINFKKCQTLQEILEKIVEYKEDINYNTWIKAIEFSHQVSLEAFNRHLKVLMDVQKIQLEKKKFWNERRERIHKFLTHFIAKAKISDQYVMQNIDFEIVADALFLIFKELKTLKYSCCKGLQACLFDKLFITLINDTDFSKLDQVKQVFHYFKKYQKQLLEIFQSAESFSQKWPSLEVFLKKWPILLMSLTNLQEKKSMLELVFDSINMPQSLQKKFIESLVMEENIQIDEESNMQIDETSPNYLYPNKMEEDPKKELSSSIPWHDFFAREYTDSNPRLLPAHLKHHPHKHG